MTHDVTSGAQPRPDALPLLVLYGTEGGNAEDLALAAGRVAAERGVAARVLGLDRFSPEQLAAAEAALFFVSTSGLGEMPENAERFWMALSGQDAPRLSRLRYGMLGLGDRSYIRFCQAAQDLDSRLTGLGARPVIDRQDCDYDFDGPAARWTEQALDRLVTAVPSLGTAARAGAPNAPGAAAQPAREVSATVTASRRLTDPSSDREVRHYTLALETAAESGAAGSAPPSFSPGDSADIAIPNDPALVTLVCRCLGLDPEAVVPEGATGSAPAGTDAPLAAILARRELRRLSVPLLAEVARRDADPELQRLLESPSAAALARWAEPRDLVQAAVEHPRARFTAAELVSLLPPLRPRAYSIASSPLVDPDRIDLTVRTVAYTADGRRQWGAVSGGLAHRTREGDVVPVRIRPSRAFHLPDDPDAAVIMVGAGVGVAPFRAFLQHRAARGDHGRSWLLYGLRSPDEDALYQDDFETWKRDGVLTRLDPVPSRGPGPREYVQHRLRSRGSEVFDWLCAGAILYVCGDARGMAPAVRLAIRAIAAERLGGYPEADRFLDALDETGHYRQDVY